MGKIYNCDLAGILESSRLWVFGALIVFAVAGGILLDRRRRRRRGKVVLRTEFEGIEYTHRVLWQIVQDQARIAAERDRDWFGPSLVAMVFAFHTVEAYANFAGEHLAPDIWADERNYFRREPYRGWEGKLRKVLELVDLPWNPEQRPLRTLMVLKELRDTIGHGKSERFSGTVEHKADQDDGMPSLPTSRIRALVTPKSNLTEMLADVNQLLDQIHLQLAPGVDDPFFKATAVGGPAAWMSRSTSSR